MFFYLSLVSGYLTYYGTIILALVTVDQNDKLIDFQKRQEQREEIQNQREIRQEKREERQELRENRHENREEILSNIENKQLEISEMQQKVANSQLRIVERELELQEIELRDNNKPNFAIIEISELSNKETVVLPQDKKLFIRGFDIELQGSICTDDFSIYISYTNISDSDAYDVSILSIEPKELYLEDFQEECSDIKGNLYGNLHKNIFDKIAAKDGCVILYYMSKEEKEIVLDYIITYRNKFHHWYYQEISISLKRGESADNSIIEYQILINNSKSGYKEEYEDFLVRYLDGRYDSFSSGDKEVVED